MKRILSQSILLLIFVLNSCSREKECEQFNVNDLQYVPYKIGDTLKFINEQNEFFNVYIKEITKSDAYSFDCKDLDNICSCINYVDIISTDTEKSTPSTFLKLEQSDASDMQYYKYQIHDFSFEFDFENELPYIQDFDNIELVDSVTISNKVYTEVIVISNTNNSLSKISKVYFNKSFGILKFSEKTSNIIWDLVN